MLESQFLGRQVMRRRRRRRFFWLSRLSAVPWSFERKRNAPQLTTQGTAERPRARFCRAPRDIYGRSPHKFHSAFWTLLDQGIISLGTFLLNLLLARQFDESEYGTFALLIGGYFFVQHFNASLIYYPMMLRLSGGKEERTSGLIFTSVVFTAASSFSFSAIVFACLVTFGRPDIAAAAALYLVLWQLQDVLRRSLLAEFRHQAAILGDGIAYMGAVGAIALLANYHNLSLETALLAMACACALAIVVQVLQRLPFFLSLEKPQELLRTFWMHGKWAFANGVILIATIQMFPWALAMVDGQAAVAEFQATLNIANVANPIAFGLCSLILPAVAQANEEGGVRDAWRAAKTYIVIGAALLSFYVALVILTPQTALFLVYGADSPYSKLDLAVSIVVFAVAINSVVDMMSAFLYGVKAAKLAVWMNGISLGVAALLLPLVGSEGVASCALALAAAKIIRLMAAWCLVTRILSPGVRFFWGRFEWADGGRGR